MTAGDYPDWGALTALQTFITNLNLASQTLQASADQIADAIAAAGTPLLHGWDKTLSGAYSVAAGSTVTEYAQWAKPGYLVTLIPVWTSTAGTVPFARVTWRWCDADPLSIDIAGQTWVVPVHDSGVYSPAMGMGPVRGPWAQLELANLDSSEAITFTVYAWEVTEHIARDDWRDASPNAFTAPAGFTVPPLSEPRELILGAGSGTTIAANGQLTYILPLYAGMAGLNITAGAGNFTARIEPALTAEEPATAYFNPKVADGTTVSELIVLPRTPCVASFANLSATSAAEVTWSLNAMEYVS